MRRGTFGHKRLPNLKFRFQCAIRRPTHLGVQHTFGSFSLNDRDSTFAATFSPPQPLWQALQRDHAASAGNNIPSDEFAAPDEGIAGPRPSSPVDPKLEAFKAPPEMDWALPAEEMWPVEGGVKAEEADAGVEERFFNREYELKYLRGGLVRKPKQPILLVGPQNCGKTALLKNIQEVEGARVLMLNCGRKSVESPELMAQALRTMARQIPSQMGWEVVRVAIPRLGEVTKLVAQSVSVLTTMDSTSISSNTAEPVGSTLTAYMDLFSPEDKSTDLVAVMNSYEILLESNTKGQVKPVIVIDEINALKRWKSSEKGALTKLLEFLKRTCKEVGAAHLILATSESFMVSWLDKHGFSGPLRRVEVLGDFSREEALRFVRGGGQDSMDQEWPGLISQFEDGKPELRREDWEKVWGACGGNPKLLRICVSNARQFKDWGKAVQKVLAAPAADVETALLRPKQIPMPEGGSPAVWTAADYKTALRLIAEAEPHHGVPQIVLEAELGRGRHLAPGVTGDDVLASMIEYNLLSVRPYSELARDIPQGVCFRKIKAVGGVVVEMEDSLVMMPSPAHLHAALKNSSLGRLG